MTHENNAELNSQDAGIVDHHDTQDDQAALDNHVTTVGDDDAAHDEKFALAAGDDAAQGIEVEQLPNNVIDLGAILAQQQPQVYMPVNPMVLVFNSKAIRDLGYVEGINKNTVEIGSQLNVCLDNDAFFAPLPIARGDDFYQVCSYEVILKHIDGQTKALAFMHHREDGDSLNVGVLGSVSINTTATYDNGCVSLNDTIRRTIMSGRQVALYADPASSDGEMNGDFFISEVIPSKVILVVNEGDNVVDRKLMFINIMVVSPGMDLNYSANISGNPEVNLLGFVNVDQLVEMKDAQDATARYVLELISESAADIVGAAKALDEQIAAHKAAATKSAMEQVGVTSPLPWEDDEPLGDEIPADHLEEVVTSVERAEDGGLVVEVEQQRTELHVELEANDPNPQGTIDAVVQEVTGAAQAE